MKLNLVEVEDRKESSMKLLFSLIVLIGALYGMIIGFLGKILVSSAILGINDLEVSLWLGVFSIVVFLSGLTNLFSSSTD